MDEDPKKSRTQHNIGQACKFCKKRHIRCDGTFPCSQCTKRNLDCVFGTKTKRGPKPKGDLHDHCNKLLVDLEVQKQISDYWKEQFLNVVKNQSTTGPMFDLPMPSAKTDMENSDSDSEEYESPIQSDRKPSSTESMSDSAERSLSAPDLTNNDFEESFVYLDSLDILVPEYSSADVNLEYAKSVYRLSRDAISQIEDSEEVVKLFEASIVSAHMFRMSARVAGSREFLRKAEEIIQILFFQKEIQTCAEYAQRLVHALLLLCLFYAGEERQGSKQSVIMLAYQIVSQHRTRITPLSMHRVYYIMLILSDRASDRIYWYQQASTILTQHQIIQPMAVASSAVMFIMCNLHPKCNFDIPATLGVDETTNYLQTIKQLEYSSTNVETAFKAHPALREIYTVFLVGVKAELSVYALKYDDALAFARLAIAGAQYRTASLHFLGIGIQCAAEAGMKLGDREIVEECLQIHNELRSTLPICNRLAIRCQLWLAGEPLPVAENTADELDPKYGDSSMAQTCGSFGTFETDPRYSSSASTTEEGSVSNTHSEAMYSSPLSPNMTYQSSALNQSIDNLSYDPGMVTDQPNDYLI